MVLSATGNKNESVKNTLVRSLTSIRQMLVDIEERIEDERKTLSEIDRDLNHNDNQIGVDKNLEYPELDNLWQDDNSTTQPKDSTFEFGKVITITLGTTSTVIPKPTKNIPIYTTTEANFLLPGEDEMKKAFIIDIKNTMASDHHGYFTAFLTRFTELVLTKNQTDGYAIMFHLMDTIKQELKEGKFSATDKFLPIGLNTLVTYFEVMSPILVMEKVQEFHFKLKAKEQDPVFKKPLNDFLNFYDSMFSKEEGETLFEALYDFWVYPEGNVSIIQTAKKINDAWFAPYFREAGKRKQRKFTQHLINYMESEIDMW